MQINPISFIGAKQGQWRVTSMTAITGQALPEVTHIAVHEAHLAKTALPDSGWILRGTNNHVRYTRREEMDALNAKKAALGRPEAQCAALIPMSKNQAWWELSQDERRHIFEEQSHHVSMSLDYLPAIARRLYHGRDLGEPFDFLTWFEFSAEHTALFDALLVKLRDSKEWHYVSHEIDIRLQRVAS